MTKSISRMIRDNAFGGTLIVVLVALVFSPTAGGALYRGTVLAAYALLTGSSVDDDTIRAFINFHW